MHMHIFNHFIFKYRIHNTYFMRKWVRKNEICQAHNTFFFAFTQVFVLPFLTFKAISFLIYQSNVVFSIFFLSCFLFVCFDTN